MTAMTDLTCTHGTAASDCIECEISFYEGYLLDAEAFVIAIKRRISEAMQRRPALKIPVIGRIESAPDGNVIKFRDKHWTGLSER